MLNNGLIDTLHFTFIKLNFILSRNSFFVHFWRKFRWFFAKISDFYSQFKNLGYLCVCGSIHPAYVRPWWYKCCWYKRYSSYTYRVCVSLLRAFNHFNKLSFGSTMYCSTMFLTRRHSINADNVQQWRKKRK